ncbi:hypothetical protein FOTG_07942 [Fusarium oxysporum f. sp. vasinfectum 25433]|uniref:Uncharacterized protein n=1 Tax=Fusarium oxysporum f. sp. vasinfectum 25433 TaxID=1089449 RepID=X0LUL9_FUSOX|nr:hypothetical protein FOTG_07942 [Fusarium oxysporum f. sp. vasinfectum 25433]
MRRCAIVINNDQSGHNYPVTVVNYYVTGPLTQINNINIEEIPSLHSFLRRRKITINLAIFDYQVRLYGTTLNASIIRYITGQIEALKDLADRLERG